MAGHTEPEYFEAARLKGQIVVREPPKLDLDAYIANYRGKTRFDRLFLIGTTSSYLYLEALKAAIAEAKRGRDVRRYEDAVGMLHEIAPEEPDGVPDLGWMDRTSKQVKAETDRLELELKGYKNNLIKESIRMGYDDLGQHLHRIGDLSDSARTFGKMREFCTTPSHVVIMKLRILNVSIDQRNWVSVQTNVGGMRQAGPKSIETDKIAAKLSAAIGLAHMGVGNYREAARELLNADPRMAGAKPDDPADDESYSEVMTPNDVAVYGGLCALASMSRDELQKKVLENTSFRNYLELEPQIRRAISFFVAGKYSACLAILNSYKPDYLLDIHLQPHVDRIYTEVRTKAIRQYFIPFSHVTISALAAAFDTDEASTEAELTALIKNGQLDARIDLVDRVLLARKSNPRSTVHAAALSTTKDYGSTSHLRLLRMEILNAGLEVKGKKGRGDARGWLNSPAPDETLSDRLAGDVFMPSTGKSLRSGLRNG